MVAGATWEPELFGRWVLGKLHPGRLTWNLQIIHLERKMIFQTSMIMFHVNLPGCSWWFFSPTKIEKICDRPKSEFPPSFGVKIQKHKIEVSPPRKVTTYSYLYTTWKGSMAIATPMYCFGTTKTNRHPRGVAPFTTVYLKLTYTVYIRIPISVAATYTYVSVATT